jgi:hypothetical protein
MHATTHSETGIVTAKKCWIGQSAAKHLTINCGMMKVQRLAGNGVGPSGPKCGANVKRSIEERFFEKVAVRENGCHEWVGFVMRNGYGQFSMNGKPHYSHRVAYELAYGKPTDYVLHKCDNRRCVNPEHLFSGSFYDNMADMVTKNRQAAGDRSGRCKLSSEDVKKIRASVGLHREIAAQFGVTPSLVSMIRSGRIWRSV